MRRLAAYIIPYKFKIALQIIIKFVGTIFDLFIPWIMAHVIDNVVARENQTEVYLWGGVMLVCSSGAMVFNIVANRMASRIAGDVTGAVRHDLFSKTMNLSCRETDKITEPSLISRLTTDTYLFHRMILRMQRLGIRAPILLIGGCIVTLMLDAKLALVLILLLPFLSFIVFYISRRGVPLYTKVQDATDILVRKVREFMSGIRVILALSKRDYERESFAEANKRVVDAEQKAGYVMATTKPIMSLTLNLGLALVIVAGAYLVNRGDTEPGKIIAFMSYFTIILNAMLSVTRIFVMLSKGTASASRIAEVLESEDELKLEQAKEGEDEDSSAHIEFRDVSFSYMGVAKNLSNVSFKLMRGQTLGIIGATGSGKSTLLMLILRFYDTDSGEILVDGINIKSIPREQLYKKFGTAFQNDILFSTSIGDNIDFGRGIALDDIKRAVKTAQASFIYEKEGEFDYKLDIRGQNLSGGQKQRLFIARALANNPDILLLDDVSSALDYRTDAKLRSALERDFDSTTKIIVSQRASTVMSSDLILVFDNGEVIGQGQHNELMENCSAYHEIYNIQMGGAVV